MTWPEAVFGALFGIGGVMAIAWVVVTAIRNPPAPPAPRVAPPAMWTVTKSPTGEESA